MSDCIFCKIINKEIPSKVVFENEKVIAFEDLNPVAPVHILVVPKKHIEDILSLNLDEDKAYLVEVYKAINKIAEEKEISKNGFRIVTNCGEDAGQTVKHLHFHAIGGSKLEGMA